MSFRSKAAIVVAYAVAMAYLESAVVVYLQRAIGITPAQLFPLQPASAMGDLAGIEVGREFATLVMLVTVGAIAGSAWIDRLAWTSVAFGVWDIFYYVFLWALLGWPTSPGTWDVLFLIPVPWAGPVWAPIAISLLLVGFGLAAARQTQLGRPPRADRARVGLAIVGGVVAILSFTLDAPNLVAGRMPGWFPWPIFLVGIGIATVAAVSSLRSGSPRVAQDRA